MAALAGPVVAGRPVLALVRVGSVDPVVVVLARPRSVVRVALPRVPTSLVALAVRRWPLAVTAVMQVLLEQLVLVGSLRGPGVARPAVVVALVAPWREMVEPRQAAVPPVRVGITSRWAVTPARAAWVRIPLAPRGVPVVRVLLPVRLVVRQRASTVLLRWRPLGPEQPDL
jgi:hypothetical protein